MDLLLSFLLKLPRIYNNFLEFNCLQFLVLFKSVFFRKLSVAEGDFRRVETLAFFPSSVKKTKQSNEKEKNYPIAIILQNNHLCKKPCSVI